jgi:DNA-binding CsgD family transcriptional regulator
VRGVGVESSRAARERRSTFEADLAPALRTAVARIFEARDDPEAMRSLFDRNDLPMVTFDDERCYRDANHPARLLFRKSLEEMRALRIEDLAPPGTLDDPEHILDQLLADGFSTGRYEMGFDDGSRLQLVYWTLAHALDGLSVSVFLPADWTEQELLPAARDDAQPPALTSRELEVLRRAAAGDSGPEIARVLSISPSTVKTHFENIYEKLGSRDRAAAVATALRVGLID